ncbi:hypothetical protein [Pseudodesulfovibrio portus]|uniref:Uncharacterized protein n=1 Tax=Pseudodesulfovibrio portus TaxID=231439 RepID=A0ABN6RPD7_9BACT|nr:hypothetical protein [Pseudodesulfovibrio portus]BDQ32659.1 hypothetical protein JCM14722_02010 [Pseudodesulfovibrio portus]
MRYLNIRNGEFTFANKTIGPIIESRIILAGKRFLQWTPNGLVGERICYDERQLPHGWTLAYDLDLELDNVLYRLTIHDGAVQHAFKPYLKLLNSRNIPLENQLTRITVIDNPRGYAALQFEPVPQASSFH